MAQAPTKIVNGQRIPLSAQEITERAQEEAQAAQESAAAIVASAQIESDRDAIAAHLATALKIPQARIRKAIG